METISTVVGEAGGNSCEAAMPLIGTRKPKCVVLKNATSASGKYRLFFGYHYLQGVTCYDVGTVNHENGEIVSRHYQDKSEALRCFYEYEKNLTRPVETEEQDENDPRIADAFRRALEGKC